MPSDIKVLNISPHPSYLKINICSDLRNDLGIFIKRAATLKQDSRSSNEASRLSGNVFVVEAGLQSLPIAHFLNLGGYKAGLFEAT